MARIVLSTFGSFGDIHPYVAIALELKARGHSPVIATSEVYREKMDAAGIELFPVRPDMPSYDQPEELTKMAEDLVHPWIGAEKVVGLFTKNLEQVYDDVSESVNGADLLLTHPLPLVGPIVAQTKKLPWVSSVLSPISFFSAYDPPVPPQVPSVHKILKLSPFISRHFLNLGAMRLDNLVKPVYSLRAKFGLPRGKNPLMWGQHSPTMVLALFSSLFGPPQPDWPRNTRVTGFPFYDRRDYFGEVEINHELLDFLDDGPPPIIFTLGSSAFWVAKDFYRDSIKAAQAVGQRALLLIGHPKNLPKEPLPDGVAAFEYAPFSVVFPKALAIVHSGGVGTTAQGLRAGRPVVVVPHAHDQFDNAMRATRLGTGRWLSRSRYNVENITRELRELLKLPDYFEMAAEIGKKIEMENGASAAADALEEMLARGVSPEPQYVASY